GESTPGSASRSSGPLACCALFPSTTLFRSSGVAGSYGHFSINAAGAWTYTADSAHNEFQDGVTYTDTFSVSSADGTLTSVTVHRSDEHKSELQSPSTVVLRDLLYKTYISTS